MNKVWIWLCLAMILNHVDGFAQEDSIPISHWIFDATHIQNDHVLDIAGGRHAKIEGKIQLANANGIGGLVLDGHTTRVAVGDNIGPEGLPECSITLEGWINLQKTIAWGAIIGYAQDNGRNEAGWFLGYSNNNFYFALTGEDRDDGDGLMTYLLANESIVLHEWNHVVGTYDGTIHSLYVNGKLVNQNIPTAVNIQHGEVSTYYNIPAQSGRILYPKQSDYTMGVYQDDDEQNFGTGILLEIRVYDIALSQEEIQRHYQEKLAFLPPITYVSDPTGNLTDGAIRIEPELWQKPNELKGNHFKCYAIFEDREQNLWFAFYDKLMRYDSLVWKSYPYLENYTIPSYCDSAAALLSNGNIVVRTQKAPLVFDVASESFHPIALQDSDYDVMKQLGPDEALFFEIPLSKERLRIQSYHAGTPVEINGGESKPVTIKADIPLTDLDEDLRTVNLGLHSILPYENGSYIFSGFSGVYLNQSQSLQKIGSLERVSCMMRYDSHTIWFGTNNQIVRFDGKNWRVIKDGLNTIFSISRDIEGKVWVGLRNSILLFYEGSWIQYSRSHGLQESDYFTIYEDRKGRTWAGSSQGIHLFHPEYDQQEPQTFLNPEENYDELTPKGNLSVVFSGEDRGDYIQTGQLLFSCRLDEQEWTPFVSKTIFLATGISPGKHVFQVRAMDLALNVDQTPEQLTFTVMYEWYWQPGFLTVLVFGILLTVFLVYRLIRAQKKLIQSATVDELTQLYNRRQFYQFMERELKRRARNQKDLSLLMIDIDKFKSINDRYGHDTGDLVLQQIAQRLSNNIRTFDILARWGGEEFIILLPETAIQEAVMIAERLRTTICDTPFSSPSVKFSCSISIGVSSVTSKTVTAQSLTKAADQALYHAKNSGRNRVKTMD